MWRTVVIVMQKVSPSLRGELTRWMLEVATGVFVGTVSATVRDLLWEKCTKRAGGGRCCLMHRQNNEQGFALRMAGDSKRSTVDVDGLMLVALKNSRWDEMMLGDTNVLQEQ